MNDVAAVLPWFYTVDRLAKKKSIEAVVYSLKRVCVAFV
jgi:hypothetical protein